MECLSKVSNDLIFGNFTHRMNGYFSQLTFTCNVICSSFIYHTSTHLGTNVIRLQFCKQSSYKDVCTGIFKYVVVAQGQADLI